MRHRFFNSRALIFPYHRRHRCRRRHRCCRRCRRHRRYRRRRRRRYCLRKSTGLIVALHFT